MGKDSAFSRAAGRCRRAHGGDADAPPLAAELDHSRLFTIWLRIRTGLGLLHEIITARAARRPRPPASPPPGDRERP